MKDLITVKLNRLDVGQIIDGLEARAESWERTQRYLESEGSDYDEDTVIEECSDENEARQIAEHYRDIIGTLNKALNSEHSHDCPSHIGQGCECGAGFGRVTAMSRRRTK